MAPLLIKLGLAPALMVAASLAARRWGPRRGGVIAAFPAIVGPLLLLTAMQQGLHAASQAASGTVLGLVGLAAFAVAYSVAAHRHREAGASAAVELLRGTLAGMAGFIAFCEVVALTIVAWGPLAAFGTATVAAILLQAPLAAARRTYPAARNSGGRSGEASARASLRPSASRSAA